MAVRSVPGTHTGKGKSLLDPCSLSPKPESRLVWKSSSPGDGGCGTSQRLEAHRPPLATSARASGRSRQKSGGAATSWCLRGVQPTSSRPQPSLRWPGIRRLGFQKSGSAVYFSFFYMLSWKAPNINKNSEKCTHACYSASPVSLPLILFLYPPPLPPSKLFQRKSQASYHFNLNVSVYIPKISIFTR